MAKKKSSAPDAAGSVTLDRALRLYRLVQALGKGPQPRTALLRRLRLGVRGFYRDLEVLRAVSVDVELGRGKYTLREDPTGALAKLPLPDPMLTMGEARLLSKGKTKAHQKIRQLLSQIEK